MSRIGKGLLTFWCLEQGSNLPRRDFQSRALPTKLSRHNFGGGDRTRTYTPYGTDLQSVCFTQFAYSLILVLAMGLEPIKNWFWVSHVCQLHHTSILAPAKGLEPPTHRLEICCTILLCYTGIIGVSGGSWTLKTCVLSAVPMPIRLRRHIMPFAFSLASGLMLLPMTRRGVGFHLPWTSQSPPAIWWQVFVELREPVKLSLHLPVNSGILIRCLQTVLDASIHIGAFGDACRTRTDISSLRG